VHHLVTDVCDFFHLGHERGMVKRPTEKLEVLLILEYMPVGAERQVPGGRGDRRRPRSDVGPLLKGIV